MLCCIALCIIVNFLLCLLFSFFIFLLCVLFVSFFFFFKQKTAYEMRISDWSSDVCSSDLKLTGDQVVIFQEFFLPEVTDRDFWDKSTIFQEVAAEQKARRKQATDVIHDKFYLLRDIAERRRIQLDRMSTGYLNAIKHHKSSKCE